MFVAIFLQQSGGSSFAAFIPMILVFVLAYFLLFVPQRRRQKAIDEMLSNLKAGDRVVTNGGVYGTIVSLSEDRKKVVLKVSENPVVRLDIARSSVSGLQESQESK